jgi:Type IV secretion-system coupling protein DNA-binding domain
MLISSVLGSVGSAPRYLLEARLTAWAEEFAAATRAPVQSGQARAVGHAGLLIAYDSLHLLAGVFVGWALAHLIRASRPHWNWTTVALVAGLGLYLLALARSLGLAALAGALGTPGALMACLVAARVSRRSQLAGAESSGSPSSAHVTSRLRADVLRALCPPMAVRIARRAVVLLERARLRAPAGGFLLGHTCDGRRPAWIPARHTIVVGATGAGKTMTMRNVVAEATVSMGAVIVDGKGDPELERHLTQLAQASGRRFSAWSPYRTTRYNPFGHGADTEIVDKALAAESWGDDYYLRLGQRFLGFAVRALRAAGREPTLSELARYADPENLEQLAPAMEEANPGSWNQLAACIPGLDRGERQAIAGTQHRLAALAESDVGMLLEPAPGHETIDLLEAVRNADVAYFNLNADARPTLSRMLGAAIVMDLVSIAATIQRRDEYTPTVVMLDDVQAFACEPGLAGIASLFARGRSAGMMLLLGTQSLADLQRDRADGMDQLLDNRTTLIVHRLPGERSATKASRELGLHEVQRLSEHLEGGPGRWRPRGSATRTRVMVPHVQPAELMELETGVTVTKTLGQPLRFVRVRSPH